MCCLLAGEKSTIEHRSSNISRPGENVASAQPRVSHEKEEIQNSNFECEDPEEDDRNQQKKELKRSQKMRLRVGLKKSR